MAIDFLRIMWLAEVGYVNFVVVWAPVQHVGFWYADGRLAALPRRAWWFVVVASVAVLVTLTGPGPYAVSMVGLPGEMSNMAPPSVCPLVLAVGQAAAVMLARLRLAAWLSRPPVWTAVVALGSMAMTIYLWHLVVLAGALGVTLWLGISLPEPGTAQWWASRPALLAILGVLLAGLVVALRRFEHSAPAANPLPATGRPRTALAGLGGSTVAAGLFGYALGGLSVSPDFLAAPH